MGGNGVPLGQTASSLCTSPFSICLLVQASHQKRDSRSRLEMLQTITLLSIAGCGMGPAAQDEAQALISYAMTVRRRGSR